MKDKCLKGQIMLETLIIVSFLFVILIPTVIYILSVLSAESWKTDASQAYATLTKIVTISNKLAIFGNNSMASETIFLPSSAKSINTSAGGREIFIVLSGPKGMDIEIVTYSQVPIVLNSSQNWNEIRGAQILNFAFRDGVIIISKSYS